MSAVYVVVGATGFLGTSICKNLADGFKERGEAYPPRIIAVARTLAVGPELSALIHRSSSIGRPLVELEVPESAGICESFLEHVLEEVCGGHVDGLFHVAGLIRHTKNAQEVAMMRAANVDVSNIVFSFVEKHQIRTVYASSSGVVGCQFLQDKLRVAHDDAPLCEASIANFPYYQQKAEVEAKWRPRALKGRAPVIFMRPSLLLGPGDDRLGSTRLVLDHLTGNIPFLPKGGMSFVDVRDAADACVSAMLNTEVVIGSALNLTAVNIPFTDFARLLEDGTHIKAARFEMPSQVATIGGRLLASVNNALGRHIDETRDPVYIEMGQRFWNVACQRALQLLEFDPREPQETIRDTARYLIREMDLRERGATFVQGCKVKTPLRISPDNVLQPTHNSLPPAKGGATRANGNHPRTVATRFTRLLIGACILFAVLYVMVSFYARPPPTL